MPNPNLTDLAMEEPAQPAVTVPPVSSAGPAIVSVPLSPAVPELMTLRPPAGGLQPPLPGVSRRPPRPPGVLAVLAQGARRVAGQPRLLILVWGLAMAAAMAASAPAMMMLGMILGKRPVALQLARGHADVLFGEVMEDHPVAVAIVVGTVLIAALLFFLIHLTLAGGLLSALRRPGHPQRVGPSISQIIARGLLTTSAMVRLELLFLLLGRLPLLLLFGGVVALGVHSKFADTHSLAQILGLFGPLAGLALWLWCTATVVLYAARLQRLGQTAGESSAWRALGAGLARTLGGAAAGRVTLTLSLVWALGMVTLVVFGRVLAARLDYALLVVAALCVRQGFALLRSALTLGIMASTIELCEPSE
jgi:hypothetical protein